MIDSELIKRYSIRLAKEWNNKTRRMEPTGMLYIGNAQSAKKDGAINEIKAHKAEIIDILTKEDAAKKTALEDRQKRIDAIEGLAEIKAAQVRLIEWNIKFDEIVDNGQSAAFLPKKPEYDFEEAYKKYPRAAAYLKADALAKNKNEKLATIGKKALEEIISGDWKTATELMNAEKEKHDKQIAEKFRVFDLSLKEDVAALEGRWDHEHELLEILSKEDNRVIKRVSYDDYVKLRDADEINDKSARLQHVDVFGHYYTVKNFFEMQKIFNNQSRLC